MITPVYGQLLSDTTGLINRFDIQTSGHTFEIKLTSNFDLTDYTFDKDQKQIILYLDSGLENNLGELIIPQNEPGSSIMPGKVNPTQCEALSMVCTQIMGLEYAVSMANSSGTLQMNEYKPLIGFNILTSLKLLKNVWKTSRN